MLNIDDPILNNQLLKQSLKFKLPRWKDTDGYTKRLFANFALSEFGDPRSITMQLKKSYIKKLQSPEQKKEAVNSIRDEFVRKLSAAKERPLVWLALEYSPCYHVHGGFVLNHTDAEKFRRSIKCLRASPNNSLETPLQSNATEKYSVDSCYNWVGYTSKQMFSSEFEYVVSEALRKEARKMYEAFIGNQRICKANYIKNKL